MSTTPTSGPQTGPSESTGHIVVGVDGSPSSILALQQARRISEALGIGIDVMAAWQYPTYMGEGFANDIHPDEDAKQIMAESIVAAFGDDAPTDIGQSAVQGVPAQVLLDASRVADMLVVGSRGRGGFVGLLLGSVSAQCAEHARCPVLVVHSRDHH
ncbi:universal stress protein UspA [Rhodococcus sp. 1163]|uniref:universal stress protein n=1 Tax=Rhodococcus sp. 1163 TaxID=1905289 RepID=UPI000A03F966|nr:universal stress protein [Rhodococcus sp. 1163]ORI20431.1 universal stress protein UspA [Rhodococcus sp. 1163]